MTKLKIYKSTVKMYEYNSDTEAIMERKFLSLVYSLLPVSLDCPFFIAPLVFSNIYLNSDGKQFQ
jgi:hypothetical protein